MRRTRSALALCFAGALAFAACGGDDESADTADTTAAATDGGDDTEATEAEHGDHGDHDHGDTEETSDSGSGAEECAGEDVPDAFAEQVTGLDSDVICGYLECIVDAYDLETADQLEERFGSDYTPTPEDIGKLSTCIQQLVPNA